MNDVPAGGGFDPGEPVPNQLRILAATENLGTLRSVHRPATRLGRFAMRSARVYRFDRAVVLGNGRGSFGLYRYDQIQVTHRGAVWSLRRGDGATVRLTRHWSDLEALGEAVEKAVAQTRQQD